MSWQIFILFSVFAYSLSVILQRSILKQDNSDAKAYSILFQFIVGVLIAGYGFAFHSMKLPNLYPVLLPLVLMVIIYGVGNIFLFSALKNIDASRFSILFAVRGLFTIVTASLFLHEMFFGRYILGTLLILGGIVIAHLRSARMTFHKQELYAVGAAACFGVGNTIDRFLLGQFELYPYVSLAFILPALLMLLVFPKSIHKMKELLRWSALKPLLLLSGVYAVSALTFFTALQKTPAAGQVAAINLSSVVVIVLFAVIFLKERKDLLQKITAAVVTFIGLLLVS